MVLREYLRPSPSLATHVLPQLTPEQFLSHQSFDIQPFQPPNLLDDVTDCGWVYLPEQSSSKKRCREEEDQTRTDIKRFRKTIVPLLMIGLVTGLGLGAYHSDAIKRVVSLYT